ncbi:hypothetical protein ACRAWF_25295 [Streptomyces sp. L7]
MLLALAGACFFLGAPPTVGAVNRLSGVPNLAAPLTYASITAYSASSQVLIVYWRGGPHVRRTARRWIVAYTFVLVGIAVMFALGDTPCGAPHRLRHLLRDDTVHRRDDRAVSRRAPRRRQCHHGLPAALGPAGARLAARRAGHAGRRLAVRRRVQPDQVGGGGRGLVRAGLDESSVRPSRRPPPALARS